MEGLTIRFPNYLVIVQRVSLTRQNKSPYLREDVLLTQLLQVLKNSYRIVDLKEGS